MRRVIAFSFLLGLAAVAASSHIPVKVHMGTMPIPVCPSNQPNCPLIDQ